MQRDGPKGPGKLDVLQIAPAVFFKLLLGQHAKLRAACCKTCCSLASRCMRSFYPDTLKDLEQNSLAEFWSPFANYGWMRTEPMEQMETILAWMEEGLQILERIRVQAIRERVRERGNGLEKPFPQAVCFLSPATGGL
jgi:hypothetical protein